MNTRLITSSSNRTNSAIMRTWRIAIIGCSLLAGLVPEAMADEVIFKGSEAETAEKVHSVLTQLSSTHAGFVDSGDTKSRDKLESYVKGMGFDSVDDLPNATVGKPVPIYSLHLDQLRAIQNTHHLAPWSILISTDGAFVPILVQQKVRSAAAVSIDPHTHVSLLPVRVDVVGSNVGRTVLTELETNPCKCFVILANALDRQFLGEGDRSQPSFNVRVLKDGPGKLRKGDLLDAKQLLAELSTEAKNSKYDLPHQP
ncbi:MAG: hypothetical protein H8J66_05425 [Nitrospira sp.]|nr:hypothetical protein [Nitrospira sp.]